jgi:hypothetical protein
MDKETTGEYLIGYDKLDKNKYWDSIDWLSLYKLADPSSIGLLNDSKIDTDIRNSKTLSFENLNIDTVITRLKESILKHHLFDFYSEYNGIGKIYCEPDKILFYSENGVFQSHYDTPKLSMDHPSEYSKATILVIPPNIHYTGGELILKTLDEEKKVIKLNEKNGWNWCLFNHNILHESKVITCGLKVVLKFNLFSMKMSGIQYFAKLKNNLTSYGFDNYFNNFKELAFEHELKSLKQMNAYIVENSSILDFMKLEDKNIYLNGIKSGHKSDPIKSQGKYKIKMRKIVRRFNMAKCDNMIVPLHYKYTWRHSSTDLIGIDRDLYIACQKQFKRVRLIIYSMSYSETTDDSDGILSFEEVDIHQNGFDLDYFDGDDWQSFNEYYELYENFPVSEKNFDYGCEFNDDNYDKYARYCNFAICVSN